MTIDADGPTPIYQQVAAIIRGRIQAGELRPDRPMPSIVQLMQEFEIARGTAVKAREVLVAEGMVIVVPGRGTFVVGPDS